MIYILRSIIYSIMGTTLLVSGHPSFPLEDVITYFIIFLIADAGILLVMRRRSYIIEAVFDLVLVIILFGGWAENVDILAPAIGAWMIVTGIVHLVVHRLPGLAAFLVIAVGIVMMLFGLILFFRAGLGITGFMGLSGLFILMPGVVMLLGGLIGRASNPSS